MGAACKGLHLLCCSRAGLAPRREEVEDRRQPIAHRRLLAGPSAESQGQAAQGAALRLGGPSLHRLMS